MTELPKDLDSRYVRSSYERLLFEQPDVPFDGLWYKDGWYFAVCPGLDERRVGDVSLQEWFDGHCRTVTAPVRLVDQMPDSGIPIPCRTGEELARLHGEPLTIGEIYAELVSALPKRLPTFCLGSQPPDLVFTSEIALTTDQESEVAIACANLKIGLNVRFEVGQVEEPVAESEAGATKGAHSLRLVSSRTLRMPVGAAARNVCEEDEEFWVDRRVEVLATDATRSKDFLPPEFATAGSACFMDAAAGNPSGIRAHLTLYDRVIIGMPLDDHLENALGVMKVEKQDLVKLAERGRVQFALPQSIDRYPGSFLSEILDVAPGGILMSRRMAAATIAASRKRLPLLYPSLGNGERRQVLELLRSEGNPEFEKLLGGLRGYLGSSWAGMERDLASRGAMATMAHGIGPLLGDLCQELSGRDLHLEMIFAAMPVEWAAGLNAILVPAGDREAPAFRTMEFCASALSGVGDFSQPRPVAGLDVMIDGLLALDSDVSVLEVDDAFTQRDRDRFKPLISRLGSGAEGAAETIRLMNDKVRKFERRGQRLKHLDVLGVLGAFAAPDAAKYISLGAWIAMYVLRNADASGHVGGGVLDWLRGAITITSGDAVLVSRLRSGL